MNQLERLENALNKRDRLTILRNAVLAFTMISFIATTLIIIQFSDVLRLVGALTLFCSLMILIYSSFTIAKLERQIDAIFQELEVDPLDMEGLNSSEVIASFQVSNMREEIIGKMIRGSDEKGPDWGRSDANLGDVLERRDAVKHGANYEGMEDEITAGELLKREADDRYAKYAQQRWEETEANDPDLIEAGLDKLGDLVRTDFFEKNAEEGAFKNAAGFTGEEGEDEK